MITVKHRRASDEEWMDIDPVIPDGELALISGKNGYDIKIGDGVRRYSELPPLIGKSYTIEDEECEVTLAHRDDVRLPGVYYLSISLDTGGHDDYTAMLTFDTLDEDPVMTIYNYNSIKFTGTDVEDGIFIPRAYMHYTLIFWRDYVTNCHVRGVYVE